MKNSGMQQISCICCMETCQMKRLHGILIPVWYFMPNTHLTPLLLLRGWWHRHTPICMHAPGLQLVRFQASFTAVPIPRSVSYTHLRAHETKANLVCRLLLEKKKD